MDEEETGKAGFTNIEVLPENKVFEVLQLIKTAGEHVRDEILNMTGIVFEYESEKHYILLTTQYGKM